MASRTMIVGDTHGCLEELDELLRVVSYARGRDRLVLLGDFMDRGPDPVGVVRRARELGAEAVLGNHDEKHLRWRRHEDKRRASPGYKNPMRSLSDQQQRENAALSDDDVAWLAALPALLRLDGEWLAVHAGIEPRRSLDEQKPAALLRVRYVDDEGKFLSLATGIERPPGSRRWAELWRGPENVAYGHHVHDLEAPTIDEPAPSVFCYGLDTGCCFGGHLSALVLPAREIVKVRARRAYAELATAEEA